MSAEKSAPDFIIEPFDPDRHDRSGFTCGVEQVDNYFKKTANKLNKADNVRLYVMVADDGDIAGFYAINAHALDYSELPNRYARTRPGHGSIPAAYISMIGRSTRYRGRGVGGDLLVDALRTIARASEQIGLSVVVLDVLDCGNVERTGRRKALYESYGFQALESDPLRLFLPMATVRKLFED